MQEVRIIELFAGVGGFRVGLERADKDFYNTVWANQWEPATKIQHAAMVYAARFGKDSICNLDINTVKTEDIPDHDMLVGGFPCQDYSVATTLSNSKGIEGKKGVLWWSIYRILKEKADKKPEIVFLENVDRLLLSPAKQRGRDFAIILECLNELGYIVEWRVINAAEYAMPQKRRRTYIVGYKKDSKIATGLSSPAQWIYNDGVFAKAFPVDVPETIKEVPGLKLSSKKNDRLVDITDNFNSARLDKPFSNSGVMIDGVAYSLATIPVCNEEKATIRSIMAKDEDMKFVTEEFYIPEAQIPRWEYFKGSKREKRVRADGFEYFYTEGGMAFPDSLDSPSRTIITSEGGKSPDRCRHVIQDQTGRLRRLIPLELERLNMFPDHHTALDGVDAGKRAFLMGNALVCGIVTRVGNELRARLRKREVDSTNLV
ncbi:MAG: DNA (cytosine-5-)-methyltransferase [Bacteroidales bacterium]|nr:DNA (cytosine-5-)-methyltransferase [Bacteroidales bacterium]